MSEQRTRFNCPIPSIIEEPTGLLRWSKDGKLQQRWKITRDDGEGHSIGRLEDHWRDVPIEPANSTER